MIRVHQDIEIGNPTLEIRSLSSADPIDQRHGAMTAERGMLARVLSCLRAEFPRIQRCLVLPYYMRIFHHSIADPGYRVFAVELRSGTKTVGVGTAQASSPPFALGLLSFVYIHPDFRRHGLARLISELRCLLMREMGATVAVAEIEWVERGCVVNEAKLRRLRAFNCQYWSPLTAGKPYPHLDPLTGARYNILLRTKERPSICKEELEGCLYTLYKIHYGLDHASAAFLARRVRGGDLEWIRPLDLL